MKIGALLFFLTVLVAGCAHGPFHRPPPPCRQACLDKMLICQKACRNNCNDCTAFNIATAKNAYYCYVHEQRIKGTRLTRTLNSYRNPLQCRKTTCSCPKDYQVCIQACGGQIFKQLKVPSNC